MRALATIPEKVLIDLIKSGSIMIGRSAWHGRLCLVPTKPHGLEVGKACSPFHLMKKKRGSCDQKKEEWMLDRSRESATMGEEAVRYGPPGWR